MAENDIRLFRNSIKPLMHASKLAVVLIQFPYSFHYTPESRKHLLKVCRGFECIPTAVEFRGDEWQQESVYRGLGAESEVAFLSRGALHTTGPPFRHYDFSEGTLLSLRPGEPFC